MAAAMIDTAAGVFARHGFDQAPVQALADATGYSKAGLLKRFGSKAGIQQAVIDTALQTSREIAEAGVGASSPTARDEAVLAALLEATARMPGYAALMLSAFTLTREPAAMTKLQPAIDGLLGAFGCSPATDIARRIAVVTALSGASVAILANRDNLGIARGPALAAAIRALGHPGQV